jgi:two-component system NarL family sensor kinase
MTLQATEAKADDPETVRSRLSGAVESIDVAIRDLRNYIFGLRPGILADRQLDRALRQLAEEFQEKSGIITVVDIDARIAARLGNSSAQLVQVAREALSNVARHAKARTCRLSLVQREEQGVLEIDDDGHGFDLANDPRHGQGLRNMRERVEAIGGEFSIDSSPAEGTTVRLLLPL